MIKKITIGVLAITALAASETTDAQQTRRLTADKHNEYGLVYNLPKTALSVSVTMRRTVNVAGPYRQFAGKYIGASSVVAADKSEWQIIDVRVTPFGIADRESQYLMQLKPGALTEMTVADDGMLLAINAADAPRTLPDTQTSMSIPALHDVDMDEYLQYVGEDFLSSQSQSRRAQMLAESIMEVRDAKIALTRGTADNTPADGRQLQLMLESLAHQEQSMTRAFTGTSYTDEMTANYIYVPDKEGRSVLMRLNPEEGPVAADDYSGEPLYISFKVVERAKLPVDEKGEEKKLPKDAVMYRIPGQGKVTISYHGANLWTDTMPMAQYGVDFGLSPTLFTDKKSPSYAIFNDVTGAVMRIGPVSEEGK